MNEEKTNEKKCTDEKKTNEGAYYSAKPKFGGRGREN